MTHFCHIPGCRIEIDPPKLLCTSHWADVPKRLKEEVCEHYRKNQGTEGRPSLGWCKAIDSAISFVAGLEGKVPYKTMVQKHFPG